MSQIRRIGFGVKMTVAMAIAAVFHFRMGVDHLYPTVYNQDADTFTHVVEALEVTIPVAIAVILLATWIWVFIAPAQEEQSRRRVGR